MTDKTLWCPGCRKIVTIGYDCGSQRCPEWEEIPEITQLKKRIEVLEDAMRGFMRLGTKLTLDESLEIWRRAFLVMGEKPPR